MAGNEIVLLVDVRPRDASATKQIEEGRSGCSRIRNLAALRSKFDQPKEPRNTKQNENPQFILNVIEEMPADIRKEYYEPKLMSFGPYHHGKPHLQRGEELKLNLAATYIKECEKTVAEFYGRIEGSIKNLKGCYHDGSTKGYSDEEFTVMMLVDGCSLLYYIFCVCRCWFPEDFNIRYQDISLLQQDTLLLENQLPFQLLLEKLMEPKLLMYMCQKFIRMNKLSPQESMPFFSHFFPFLPIIRQLLINLQLQQSKPAVEQVKPCHLLDLFRRNILGESKQPSKGDGNSDSKNVQENMRGDFLSGDGKFDKKKVEEAIRGDPLSFTNVKELMARGIRVKRSHTSHLTDISFSSNGITACLRLPPITIDKSTKTIFLNLIAYEMSSDVPHDFISYLRLLDSLFDYADDVKELQSLRVLQNNLGTHEEVAQFFNTVRQLGIKLACLRRGERENSKAP